MCQNIGRKHGEKFLEREREREGRRERQRDRERHRESIVSNRFPLSSLKPLLKAITSVTKYSRMDQVKFVKGNPQKI